MFEKIVVSKFGGTSMGDAACMRRSAEVARERGACLVVVSATSGTTNDLIKLAELARDTQWSQCEVLINQIRQRHELLADELQLRPLLRAQLTELMQSLASIARGIFLLKECSPRALDTVMSFGERMSSVLFVEALTSVYLQHQLSRSVEFLDARSIIITDDQFGRAKPLVVNVSEQARIHLSRSQTQRATFVTQGFIGCTVEGSTTTLGRGGSDYSAALFAEAINADSLEIWTDVAGIATTDPRLSEKARPLSEISFSEASELATFGAKVLHPATLLPAVRRDIPVFVGSSFDPKAPGTWVKKDVAHYPLMRAVALRKDQALVTLTSPEMLQTHGFLARLFDVFNRRRVSIDAITTSEISVSVTLDIPVLKNQELFAELSRFCEVQVEQGLSLVSLIGNHINHTPGLAQRVFQTLADINVRMICLGASKHNFCLLVNEGDGPQAVRRLHDNLLLATVAREQDVAAF
jgi:aspartate kinase